ncbi:MAG TPA: glutamate--tRNA ligase [Nitrospinae bacterium]|jgi:glutamyl-tRNA synthetase|nr:glutamate--tRNA ligase [Nitrospinota bacterium]
MSVAIKVRFAPSPTGFLHIGGVRTALFNWLFAKNHGGKFVLRIEDTDLSRSTEESIEEILESMRWLGLDWDEGPFRQTERQEIYSKKVEQLLSAGKAYHCYCTPEELDRKRSEAQKAGNKPKYDGTCRERSDSPEGAPSVVRFKAPIEGTVVVEDLLRGKVIFDIAELDDLILQRTDGTPTYNFVVVVDDSEMDITHVIRGDDHLSNTPRQCLLYDALDYPRPKFTHISMILGQDKSRLSKRHGATSALVYRDMGYLPDAMINYLARLGWSHGDQEIFSREELIKYFSFDSVHTSAAVFDADKLSWLNEHYIKSTPPEELVPHLEPHLIKTGVLEKDHGLSLQEIARVIPCLNERAKTLVEMAEKSAFFFKKEVEFDEKARSKFLTEEARPLLEKMIAGFSTLDDFSAESIESLFKKIVEEEGMKLGKLAQPVRVALTGTTVSPGIYDVILLLGKEETLKRLQNVV